uniref:Uncharacterized protein n=1 Tax=Steinernema glaseri TaxID=37863 RepID=A0A1I8AMG7_9BILA
MRTPHVALKIKKAHLGLVILQNLAYAFLVRLGDCNEE